jgi:alpha-amylase
MPSVICTYVYGNNRVYYGSEWLYSGGNDPNCREPLWNTGVSYDATKAPLGSFLTALNKYRKANEIWSSKQSESWRDDTYYAFYKEPNTLAVFTNVGSSGQDQSRTLPFASLPTAWRTSGVTICNALDSCSTCTTTSSSGVTVKVSARSSVAVYTEQSNC